MLSKDDAGRGWYDAPPGSLEQPTPIRASSSRTMRLTAGWDKQAEGGSRASQAALLSRRPAGIECS